MPDANGNLAAVRSRDGHVAWVAPRYRRQFQDFINALQREGYRIKFMGGWRAHGTCRECDAHPHGRAIDINQLARNRVTSRFPSNVTALAERFGLCHGAIWDRPDTGHFEIAAASRSTQCRALADRQHFFASATAE
jgi:hypothetical protein